MTPRSAPLPPQNLEAEEFVVGACLLSENALDACAAIVSPQDFYRPSHGLIFAAAAAMRAEGQRADPVTVVARLERDDAKALAEMGGPERIREIASIVPATTNAAHWATIVKDLATRRGLADAGRMVYDMAMRPEGMSATELLDGAERLVFDLARENDHSEFVTLSETIPAEWDRLNRLHAGEEAPSGIKTGLDELDDMTSGLQSGNLIVVAGRPSMGKSALALCVVADVAVRQGLPVALFSLEMNRDEVTQRLLSQEGDIDSRKIRSGKLDVEDWSRAATASGALKEANLFIDDARAITIPEIRSKCRRLKMRRPDLAVVVLDYLQLMGGDDDSESRVLTIGRITRALKVLAGDLGVPIVALSQLSRAPESRHDHRAQLSDLRESGAIEQDADVVLLLYRDEYYHPEDTDQLGVAEINVAKARSGPTGTVKVGFAKRYARFHNLGRQP